MSSLPLPPDWLNAVLPYIAAERVGEIYRSSVELRGKSTVYPPEELVFNAFHLTRYDEVKAVILGQDPYFGEGEAHGLAFSVPNGVKMPPTLRNIFKEYASDLDRPLPENSDLSRWAQNGVLLLNSILTVEAGKPESHKNLGWQEFTDAVIKALGSKKECVTFILWGNYARSKAQYILPHHRVLESSHPSPLAAYRGFFGSKPFSGAETDSWKWPEV